MNLATALGDGVIGIHDEERVPRPIQAARAGVVGDLGQMLAIELLSPDV